MTLTERLRSRPYRFTGLWIESHEHHRRSAGDPAACSHRKAGNSPPGSRPQGLSSPGVAGVRRQIRSRPSGPRARLAQPEGTTPLALQNFHRSLQSAEVVQRPLPAVLAGKQNRTFVVVICAVVNIPVELEKLFLVLEHELPGRDQLAGDRLRNWNRGGDLPSGCRARHAS